MTICVCMKVTQSCPTLCNSMDYSLPDSSVHGILWARILEWVAFPFSRGSSHPRIEPRSPALQVVFSPAEPQGKLKNTGVGSLSLLQGIFLTQCLLHCKWILYQLSYQGSPFSMYLLHLLHWQAGSLPLASPGKSWLNTIK